MPRPDRLLNTLRQAETAFRATPGRRGRVVELPADSEVLVAGDLHGNVTNLQLLLRQADLGSHPQRHLVLQELIHGPHSYPTGGDKSHQMLDLLAALKCQYPRQVHMLLGNHELAQWTRQRIGKGDRDLNDWFREGIVSAYGTDADAIYAGYERLFAVMSLVVRTANRVFLSHSLPAPAHLESFRLTALEREDPLPEDLRLGGPVHAIVWGRDVSAGHVAEFLKRMDADLLITGHIPCERGFAVPNDRQLILDSLGAPACYCLFPTDRPLTHGELTTRVQVLGS